MKYIIALLIFLSLAACQKNEVAWLYPIQPTNISKHSITCGAYILPEENTPAIISCGVFYSFADDQMANSTRVEADSVVQKGAYKCVLTGLAGNVDYAIWPYYETNEMTYEFYSQKTYVRTEYTLGHSGPAGGIICHLNPLGGGIEVSPVDVAKNVPWGCMGEIFPGADVQQLYGGGTNTSDILAFCTENSSAAALCNSYSLNGFDDWVLPSPMELNAIFNYVAPQQTSGLSSYHSYWSSYQSGENSAFAVNMSNGGFQDFSKSMTGIRVRAIRYF